MLKFQQPIMFLQKSFKYIITYELQLQICLLPKKQNHGGYGFKKLETEQTCFFKWKCYCIYMRVKEIQRLYASHGNYEQQKREMKTNHWDACFQDQCSLKLLKYFPGPFEQNKSSKHINNCVKWDWPQCIGCCRRAGRFGRGGWGSVQMMGCCDDWLVKEGLPRLQNSNTAGNYP